MRRAGHSAGTWLLPVCHLLASGMEATFTYDDGRVEKKVSPLLREGQVERFRLVNYRAEAFDYNGITVKPRAYLLMKGGVP